MGSARRSIRLVAGCILASFVLAACRAELSNGPTTLALRHFDGAGLAFDYPSAWRGATFDVVSSFSNAIVYLSTAPLSDPCDRTANSIACVRNAVSGLDPDGILVEWSHSGFPGWTFDPTKGQLMKVGGRTATLEVLGPSEACAAIAGVREVVVTIEVPTADQNWTEMRACLRGPSLDDMQEQINAMLGSVAWRH